ncbi:MAG: helix-turn-helix transcriptional regulator [Syntrophorhabdaceae bacterium]|nr:helix-turn-helix transcriptional regulator [Syntrophorhabdaceae bacterium]
MQKHFYTINGPLIKARLFELDLYQWELARNIKIADPYLSKIIHGQLKASESLLKKMAKVLKMNPAAMKREG